MTEDRAHNLGKRWCRVAYPGCKKWFVIDRVTFRDVGRYSNQADADAECRRLNGLPRSNVKRRSPKSKTEGGVMS